MKTPRARKNEIYRSEIIPFIKSMQQTSEDKSKATCSERQLILFINQFIAKTLENCKKQLNPDEIIKAEKPAQIVRKQIIEELALFTECLTTTINQSGSSYQDFTGHELDKANVEALINARANELIIDFAAKLQNQLQLQKIANDMANCAEHKHELPKFTWEKTGLIQNKIAQIHKEKVTDPSLILDRLQKALTTAQKNWFTLTKLINEFIAKERVNLENLQTFYQFWTGKAPDDQTTPLEYKEADSEIAAHPLLQFAVSFHCELTTVCDEFSFYNDSSTTSTVAATWQDTDTLKAAADLIKFLEADHSKMLQTRLLSATQCKQSKNSQVVSKIRSNQRLNEKLEKMVSSDSPVKFAQGQTPEMAFSRLQKAITLSLPTCAGLINDIAKYTHKVFGEGSSQHKRIKQINSLYKNTMKKFNDMEKPVAVAVAPQHGKKGVKLFHVVSPLKVTDKAEPQYCFTASSALRLAGYLLLGAAALIGTAIVVKLTCGLALPIISALALKAQLLIGGGSFIAGGASLFSANKMNSGSNESELAQGASASC